MRLWSLHPRYLDAAGLVACWRESLLAQKALGGATTGYRNHPQLERFRENPAAIGAYLHGLADEADARGYRFDRTRVAGTRDASVSLTVTLGQVDYERRHLLAKLQARSPERVDALRDDPEPATHPIFHIVDGGIERWERVADGQFGSADGSDAHDLPELSPEEHP